MKYLIFSAFLFIFNASAQYYPPAGGGGGGSGTVTSVAQTVPAFLSITGSPVTTSGTLAIGLSGTALPVANGGTGITSLGAGVATFLGTPSSTNLASAVTNETGSGNLVFSAAPTLTTPELGAASCTFTSLNVTTTAAILATNTTPAAAGAQQVSPAVRFTGQGWKTTATAGSQPVDFLMYVLPVQGATLPSGIFKIQSSINGVGPTDSLSLTNGGALTLPGGLTAGASSSITGTLTASAGLTTSGNITATNAAAMISLSKTVTAAGTTGAQTINQTSGTVNLAALSTSLVVTNSIVTTSSIIICTVGTNDANTFAVTAVAAAGSFTIRPNQPPAAETRVNFLITN